LVPIPPNEGAAAQGLCGSPVCGTPSAPKVHAQPDPYPKYLFRERVIVSEVLDGDEVPHLSRGLTRSPRRTAILYPPDRVGARLLARNGGVAITAAISPYADVRDEGTGRSCERGVPFVGVYAEVHSRRFLLSVT